MFELPLPPDIPIGRYARPSSWLDDLRQHNAEGVLRAG